MKQYPHILGAAKAPKFYCYAFEKLDGSNLRWEWQKKRGFCKYGTRSRLFDETDELFGQAIPIFFNEMADYFDALFRKLRTDRGIVYTEFMGDSSFAGAHLLEEPKELWVFDFELYKKGIVTPQDFLKHTRNAPFNVAQLVYQGNFNKQFVNDVRNGIYDVWEGVVAKGVVRNKSRMRKVKTFAYLEKLREVYRNGWQEHWE